MNYEINKYCFFKISGKQNRTDEMDYVTKASENPFS